MIRWFNNAKAHAAKAGTREALKKLAMTGEYRVEGTLVGVDANGNRYFENKEAQWGRDRWVEYSSYWEYDASQVPAEWHGWLHHVGDAPASEVVDRRMAPEATAAVATRTQWRADDHVPNMTGTAAAYVPTSHFWNQHEKRSFQPVKERMETWNGESSEEGATDTNKEEKSWL